jgi:hypothetical protein
MRLIFSQARELEERGRILVTKIKVAEKRDDPTERAASYDFIATGV